MKIGFVSCEFSNGACLRGIAAERTAEILPKRFADVT
jgi:hypothetical protein